MSMFFLYAIVICIKLQNKLNSVVLGSKHEEYNVKL